MVTYALDPGGEPILALSELAEHSRNLAADARASLMATEQGDGDPLARGRATLLGTVAALAGDERAEARARYLAAHPAASYVDFKDFRLWRMSVQTVRYVGGFGRMSWIDAAAFRAS